MLYNEFKGLQLPALGMGCMRLPGDGYAKPRIEENETEQMIDLCMQGGINYFDTAWGYHSGNSEPLLGRLLQKYPRESFYLASKFPGYDLSNLGKAEEIFVKQLEKCRVDYFDFYLFHNVCELNIDGYLDDEKYGDFSYLLKQKQNGRIRFLGCSVHGDIHVLKRFLATYGEHMDFCQIQLNYLDWEFQDAKAKVELLSRYNIPVWVMEPLRGGKLANLDKKHTSRLRTLRPDESIPGWGFRFLQSIPEVKVVLSGMSSLAQLQENIKIMSERKPLSENEWNILQEIANEMATANSLPCTACRYCVDHCPMELNIPWIIDMFNEINLTTGVVPVIRMRSLPTDKQPSACLQCRSCEAVCPQQIKIADMMKNFAEKLNQ
ncbi:MAG: 4Fe-4S dicluster domain-containing protein [Ruminococcaceae bacterium]|nr:4Fe-4S dicluster domain-containing protein [Oscillospiraceae bacterium]